VQPALGGFFNTKRALEHMTCHTNSRAALHSATQAKRKADLAKSDVKDMLILGPMDAFVSPTSPQERASRVNLSGDVPMDGSLQAVCPQGDVDR